MRTHKWTTTTRKQNYGHKTQQALGLFHRSDNRTENVVNENADETPLVTAQMQLQLVPWRERQTPELHDTTGTPGTAAPIMTNKHTT